MSWEIIATYAVAVCLIIGALFSLVGSIGLLKFNNSMTRLHAPSKVSTMGIGTLLLASMIHSFLLGHGTLGETLIMAFLFVTAPISTHFIAKVHIHRRSCQMPPPPPEDDTWSTFNVPTPHPETDPETEEQTDL